MRILSCCCMYQLLSLVLPLFVLELTLLFRILQVTRGGVMQAHRPGNRRALCSLCAKWDCADRAEAWSHWARPYYATRLIGACFDVQIYPEINTTLRTASYLGPQASHHTQMPQTGLPMVRYNFSLFVDVVLVPQLHIYIYMWVRYIYISHSHIFTHVFSVIRLLFVVFVVCFYIFTCDVNI